MPTKPTYDELEKRIQNLKVDTEEQYQSILNIINEGVILLSASGNILTWNKVAEEIFGIGNFEITHFWAYTENTKTDTVAIVLTEFVDVSAKQMLQMIKRFGTEEIVVSARAYTNLHGETTKTHIIITINGI